MSFKNKILIVDDEPDILKVLSLRLETAGYDVVTALDGKEGLQKARDHKPNLIILDLMLPYMDGMKVCALLKSDKRFSHIPVIILTASADQSHKNQGEKFKVNSFFNKPIVIDKLLVEISRLLRGDTTYEDSLKQLEQRK